jgi:microcystin-dependent protein
VCPIKFVEIEFSLWSTEMLGNGVADISLPTCQGWTIPKKDEVPTRLLGGLIVLRQGMEEIRI